MKRIDFDEDKSPFRWRLISDMGKYVEWLSISLGDALDHPKRHLIINASEATMHQIEDENSEP